MYDFASSCKEIGIKIDTYQIADNHMYTIYKILLYVYLIPISCTMYKIYEQRVL